MKIYSEAVEKYLLCAVIISVFFENMPPFVFWREARLEIPFQNIALLLLTVFLLARYFLRGKKTICHSRFLKIFVVFMAAWFFYAIVQLWVLSDFRITREFRFLLPLLLNACVVACVCVLVRAKKDVFFAFEVIRTCTIFLLILSVAEYVTGYHLFMSRYSDSSFINLNAQISLNISTGIFNHEDQLSFFYVIAAPVFIFSPNKSFLRRKVPDIFFFFLCFVMVAASGSAGCILSFFIVCFTALLSMRKNILFLPLALLSGMLVESKLMGYIKEFFSFCGHAMIHAVKKIQKLPAYPFSFHAGDNTFFVTRLYEQAAAAVNGEGGALHTKLRLAQEGLRMTAESFFLGSGVNGFYNGVNAEITDGKRMPQNFWIEVLSQYGILIFVLFAVLYFYAYVRLLKTLLKQYVREAAIAFSSMTGFILASMIPDSVMNMQVVWVFLSLYACTCSFFTRKMRTPKEEVLEEEDDYDEEQRITG